jgi:hypothetical protein
VSHRGTVAKRAHALHENPCSEGHERADAALEHSSETGDRERTKLTLPPTPPPAGPAALINPRSEDPLALLSLDLGSFLFDPNPLANPVDKARAKYTIDLFKLNKRAELPAMRKSAFQDFVNACEAFALKRSTAPPHELDAKRLHVQRHPHQTVWREMQRQAQNVSAMKVLFNAVPEALAW